MAGPAAPTPVLGASSEICHRDRRSLAGTRARRTWCQWRARTPGSDPGDDDGDNDPNSNDESFLLGGCVRGHDAQGAKPADEGGHWFKSKAYQAICRPGAGDLPGNYNIAVPMWLLYYFRDTERAVVFAQVLYWFSRSKHGKIRVTRWDDGRPVVNKTHQELADEVGLKNPRRIEKHLKAFKAAHLLDYDPHYGTGKGRTTRIWLNDAGVLKAYQAGCKKVEEMKAR